MPLCAARGFQALPEGQIDSVKMGGTDGHQVSEWPAATSSQSAWTRVRSPRKARRSGFQLWGVLWHTMGSGLIASRSETTFEFLGAIAEFGRLFLRGAVAGRVRPEKNAAHRR